MAPAFERVPFEGSHAYGWRWRDQLIAYVWWEQDAARRSALGWYLRDLRVPGQVWRLDVDPAIAHLADDQSRSPRAWLEDAERLRALTLAAALRRAEGALTETLDLPEVEPGPPPRHGYDVYVRGLALDTLALGFPGTPVSTEAETHVLHLGASQQALSRTLALIAALGGRVVGIIRRAG